ncbi:MAG: glutamate mutase L [Bacillota bacterium]
MKIDVLVAEIGSTTTVVNAFNIHDVVQFLGRGVANTTVKTDVNQGLEEALTDLEKRLSEAIEWKEMFAASSAAGGLRMSVSGLVHDMTVRASKEAALNAGANIDLITSGNLEWDDLEQLKLHRPNIVLVSGGTDYGDKRTAYENIKKIKALKLNVPIVYAGNIDNHYRIRKLFENSSQKDLLHITENVYPRVDYMNIHPLRRMIYRLFEENITKAKGMEYVRTLVNKAIMPTPGSVMEASMKLNEEIGNLMVIDVGGATTDVHSITTPREEYEEHLEGEPKEKRTVEGDLGVFINAQNVWQWMDEKAFIAGASTDEETLRNLKQNYSYIPRSAVERAFVKELTRLCVFKALDRHVGDLKKVYTSSGRKVIPEGRDVSKVQHIVLTGGALVNLEDTETIIHDYIKKRPNKMMPENTVKIHKDHDYILGAAGVLSLEYPKRSKTLILRSLRMEAHNDLSKN